MKEKTTSFCPVCKKTIPAVKTVKGGNVTMDKTCPEHGMFSALVSKDARRFFDKTFDVAGKAFTPCVTAGERDCPDACGWCDQHKQHICTGLVEVTDACNLRCPICYFGDKNNNHLSLDEIENRVDTLLKVENGKLDVLQLSGGECLIHPDFPAILETILRKNITRVLVNTNGIGLLADEKVFDAIKKNKDRVEVYLQFDGFDDEVYEKLRGVRFVDRKLKMIEKLNAAAIKIGLAVTVFEGNLQEVPKTLDFACKTPHISGVTFQRLAKFGAAGSTDLQTVLQEDILLAITQSGLLRYQDIIPLPCSHPNCTSLAFLFVTKDKVYNIGEYVDYTRCKDVLGNRIAFDDTVLEYVGGKVCDCFAQNVIGSKFNLDRLQAFIKNKQSLHEDMKILRIGVKNFMDHETFDFTRAKKCCVGVAAGDGKVVPFCVHNNLKGALK